MLCVRTTHRKEAQDADSGSLTSIFFTLPEGDEQPGCGGRLQRTVRGKKNMQQLSGRCTTVTHSGGPDLYGTVLIVTVSSHPYKHTETRVTEMT